MRAPSSVQIAVTVLILVLLAGIGINHDRLRRAEQRAATAATQSRVASETARQLDHYTTTTTIVREKAEEAEREVKAVPGASAPLDPDVRRALCAGLGRMRDASVCTD